MDSPLFLFIIPEHLNKINICSDIQTIDQANWNSQIKHRSIKKLTQIYSMMSEKKHGSNGEKSLIRRKFVKISQVPELAARLNKRKKVWIPAVIVLIVLAFAGVRHVSRQKAMRTMAEQMNQSETTQVTKKNLIDSISVTGTIASADARDVSAIASNVEVKEVYYEVGDYVNAGDVVVILDSAELERKLTEAENSQALSAYNENKSIETAAENYAEAVEDGTDNYSKAVRNEAQAKEDLQEAERDLNSAASKLKRREERLSEAKKALDAAEKTEKPDASAYGGEDTESYQAALAAYESYQALQKAVNEAQTAYTEAHQEYNSAADAEEKASDAYETAAENLTDASKNNDRNISNAADSLEKAQKEKQYSNNSSAQTMEDYQEQMAACTVTAPISGVITAMEVEVGDTYMGEGKTLFSIADQERFLVTASVDEYEVSSISKGMVAAVIVEALGEEEMPAKVSYISPTATAASGQNSAGSAEYALEIALDDKNTDLRIGMTAKASIIKNAVYDVLTVPYDCVITDEEGNSSLYIEKNGEKVQISVTVGMQSDYEAEVSGDGLTEDTIVYYQTPMIMNGSSAEETEKESGMSFDRGGAPGGGLGGGMPGGGPGGF